MGRRRNFGRALSGVIVIDKPSGMTSNDVVQKAKRLFFANKAGHTGALDPLATGVLPVCFGEATKFSQYLLDADKVYESVFCFGAETDTADSDGKVVSEVDASHITLDTLTPLLDNYRGDISQIPPMYSALKKDGQPLYKLARQGIEVEREPRNVTVYVLELLGFSAGARAEARVRVSCSKGTYIRSIASDLGRDLGVGGHVKSLRRIKAGAYTLADAHSLDELESRRGEQQAETLDELLFSVDSPVEALSQLTLSEDDSVNFCYGQAVSISDGDCAVELGQSVRVFLVTGAFLGVGEIIEDAKVKPKRLVVN
ncbi:MAG: tRNA pseudouridine(55) synthase TruB [Alteromonadaceae bacterium]|nr:MAG: tRNA pseudouridine(55) synthase TruB [Alteromonadaceae bacterium]